MGTMRSSKLWILLSALNWREQRAFTEMITSLFFNKQESVVRLYEVMIALTRKEQGETEPDQIFAEVFPGEPFSHAKLRYVMTDLTRLLEQFMVLKALEDDSATRNLLLLKELKARKLSKPFEEKVRERQTQIQSNPIRDSQQLMQRFLLEELNFDYSHLVQNRQVEEMIPDLMQHLESFALAMKLKYLCEWLNRRNVLAGQVNEALVNEVLNTLTQISGPKEPAVALYEKVLYTLLYPAEDLHYVDLKKLLTKHAAAFTLTELGQLYAFALNYCIKRFNIGDRQYLRELYELYQVLTEARILHENGILAPQHYKNIVAVAIRLEEYDWAGQFIERFKGDLPEHERTNAYVFNSATLQFAQGNFKAAIRLLQQVAFTDPYYQLDARAILAKCYYEMEDFEPLFSLIAAFRLFLRRNKAISDYQKELYRNMLKLIEKMAKASIDPALATVGLKNEILNSKETADAGWLRKMAEQLIRV